MLKERVGLLVLKKFCVAPASRRLSSSLGRVGRTLLSDKKTAVCKGRCSGHTQEASLQCKKPRFEWLGQARPTEVSNAD
jgi:hypothetical protein